MPRVDDLFPGASFRLEGECYTIREFRNGMAVCEREDGSTIYLHGWENTETWEPPSLRVLLSSLNPLKI